MLLLNSFDDAKRWIFYHIEVLAGAKLGSLTIMSMRVVPRPRLRRAKNIITVSIDQYVICITYYLNPVQSQLETIFDTP